MLTSPARAILLALLLALALSACASDAPDEDDDRPSFVVILTDDMRADELQYMPHTRRLIAEQGVTYTNAISPHPLCCPARAGLMTGQYAHNNGVRHNDGPKGGFDSLEDKPNTLGRWLHDSGYQTGFVGKYLNGYRGRHGRQPGWTEWLPLVRGLYHFERFRFFEEEPVRDGYVTTAISDRTDKVLRSFAGEGKPFLVMTNHIAPHQRTIDKVNTPPVVEPRHQDAYDGARNPAASKPSYNEPDLSDKPKWLRNLEPADDREMQELFLGRIRSLQSVDEDVARIVETLEETGELANTHIVFTSDNGFSLGEHRFDSKNRLLDENLRIPLLMRGPGIEPGTTDDRLASLLDLPATIAQLAGVEPQRKVDALSLQSRTRRDTLLVQIGGSAASTGGTQLSWRGVLTDRYAWAVNTRDESEETFYDHRADPFELVNVADDPRYAEVRAELRRRYLELAECAGRDCNQRFGSPPVPDA